VEKNLAKIQSQDIPCSEAWAQGIGSCFALEKTKLNHLTKKQGEHLHGQISVKGIAIPPSSTAKLLGVRFGCMWSFADATV
jgi:hypothetical protein